MNDEPTRKDLARILREGSNEIERLRQENASLAAQVRVIDVFDRACRREQATCYVANEYYMLGRLAAHFEKAEEEGKI